jgi:hypothetical protein
MRAGPAPVVAALDADLGLGQVLGASDANRRVGAIFAGSWQGVTPEREVLSENTSDDGKVFTDSARFLCYRLEKIRNMSLTGRPHWRYL